jgi:CheY-like chemotaxis protein
LPTTILVLVVEDDPLIQLEVEDALKDGGYSTITANNGEDAVAIIEENAEYRALITDVNLGGEKTGWDVAQRARERTPDLPVIYVTSIAGPEWTSRGVPKSILIQKPFAPVQITTAIAQLMNTADTLGTT